MNLSSVSNSENAKKKEKGYSCSCCEQVFSNYEAFVEHQREHQGDIIQQSNQNDVLPSHNSIDINKSNLECRNVQMKNVFGGTANNPYAMKGIYYDNNGQEDNKSLFMSPNYSSTRSNNASSAALVQSKDTVPFVQSVDNPIYMSIFDNFTGLTPMASSIVNHHASNSQFFVDNFSKPFRSNFQKIEHNDKNVLNLVSVTKPSFPSYCTTHNSSNGPNFLPKIKTNKFPNSDKPSCVDIQTHSVGSYKNYSYNIDQISERVKRYNQENFAMINPPKRPNINSVSHVFFEKEMLQKKKNLLSTNNTKFEAGGASLSKDEATSVSIPENTKYVKEKDEDDLDLSLHL